MRLFCPSPLFSRCFTGWLRGTACVWASPCRGWSVWEYREGVTAITSGYNSRLRSWWEFSCSEVSSVSPSQEITVFTLFFCFFQQLWGVQILCGTRTNTWPRNQCSGSTRFLPAKETTRGTGTHTVRLISKLGADQLSDPWYSTRDWLLFKIGTDGVGRV